MNILVLNSGSSSIKYQLLDVERRQVYGRGAVDRIGEEGSSFRHSETGTEISRRAPVKDHEEGFALLAEGLAASGLPDGIGHRVVHGGEAFSAPVLIDARVVEGIRRQIPLAPLHNPGNLAGIEGALRRFPGVPQVAVFDTAFHQTLPPRAFRYALPRELYERHGIRRYGFHGTSHRYVSRRAEEHLGRPAALVVLHLGNGASAAAVDGGRSVDTSMGLTPLEGLVMGTRSGDVDPAALLFLARAGRSFEEIDAILNRESGLKGLAGVNDMRELLRRAAGGDAAAALAFDVYCYRIRKYIGAYAAALGRLDAVVFTAGVGENSPEVRERSCEGLGVLGIEVDPARNRAPGGGVREIQSDRSRVKVLVIPTNEELEIAEQARECILASRLGT